MIPVSIMLPNHLIKAIEFQSLTAKTFVFHPASPFRIAKRPFLGQDFQEAFLGICVHVFEIIRT